MKTGLQLANVVHGTSLFIKGFLTKHDIRVSKFLTSGLYLPSLSIYSPPPPSPSSPVYPPLLPSNLMTSLLFISTINFQYQFTLHFHHHRFHQFIQLQLHYRKLRGLNNSQNLLLLFMVLLFLYEASFLHVVSFKMI